MPINTTKVAEAAQAMMAYLEESHSDSELVDLMIIAHCTEPSEDDDNPENVREHTPIYCTNPSRIYQTGLTEWAHEMVAGDGVPDDEPEPPE